MSITFFKIIFIRFIITPNTPIILVILMIKCYLFIILKNILSRGSLMQNHHSSGAPELTIRAILTGILLGALLTPCNVYTGLKIAWGFNMSVAAGLIGFAFWSTMQRLQGTSPLSLYENNINQTTTSSAAAILSSGLAAPIPALALLTNQTLTYPILVIWLLVVSFLGIVVAAGLRNQMLVRENLPFPAGVVTAETMQEIHRGGKEAAINLKYLFSTAALSAAFKVCTIIFNIKPLAPLVKFDLYIKDIGNTVSVYAKNFGLALDPSFLLFGFGAIVGLRIGVSILIGTIIAWAMLAPMILTLGWAKPGDLDQNILWYGPLVEWLIWPGATLMTTAALTSFIIIIARIIIRKRKQQTSEGETKSTPFLSNTTMFILFAVSTLLLVVAQNQIFNIALVPALIAVLLSYILAIVAARVTGETSITPIGALGKITQFTFGAITPGNMTANLMTANVTGGSAGQCADLMNDLRTGQIIGATPHFQVIAQVFGILVGSLVGAITYLLLIPNPQQQLLTEDWPAPAVATWKAVAEVLSKGFEALPEAAMPAIIIAGLIGILMATLESLLPEKTARYIPSASAIGLGFVIPAWNSISLFLGAITAALLTYFFPNWSKRRITIIASGLIVGESLTGVITAMLTIVG